MKIFISYRRKDSGRDIGRIRDKLKKEFGEENVFRDLVDIPPGADFRSILEEKTNHCDAMLVLIGPTWAGITDSNGNKRLFEPTDFTRVEVETGLRKLREKKAIVIPVFVMNASMPSPADLPETLCQLTFQNGIEIHDDPYFDFDMGRLIAALKASNFYGRDDLATESYEPKMVYIPEGSFQMGSQPGADIPDHESPQHLVNLPGYHIGRSPVRNSEYEEFIHKTGKLVPRVMSWNGQSPPADLRDSPALGVTWNDAIEYCEWLSEATQRKYSLANEAQWEKACRTQQDFDGSIGNILEWTSSLWGEKRIAPDAKYTYPWKDDGRNDLKAGRQIRRVVRGYADSDEAGSRKFSARCGRDPNDSGSGNARHGFRVILIR